MEGHDSPLKPSTLASAEQGMTLLELLVATTLGLMLIGMSFSSILANQRLFEIDLARTRLNQNLRTAIDLVGSEIRQAGERLPEPFPAIEIVNGANGASDELVIRRNLLDQVLTVCQLIKKGESATDIFLSNNDAASPPACQYSGQEAAFAAWQDHREENGGTVQAYIFNLASGDGEFIEYVGESDSGGVRRIRRSSGSMANRYEPEVSAVYILREWRFRMDPTPGNTDILQIIQNEDEENPLSVVFGINTFQVRAFMQDGTIAASLDDDDSWALLQAVEVTLAGEDRSRRMPLRTELSARFFPRNILSQ